ncbi:MAG: hypothetical protein ACLFPL_05590 [Candidatus Nanoarchaeia archaeon]
MNKEIENLLEKHIQGPCLVSLQRQDIRNLLDLGSSIDFFEFNSPKELSNLSKKYLGIILLIESTEEFEIEELVECEGLVANNNDIAQKFLSGVYLNNDIQETIYRVICVS